MTQSRKVSFSFVSEVGQSTTFDYTQGHTDPVLKALHQNITRVQALQVVFGLILLILSAVAIIEERTCFGLGFPIFSSLIIIFTAAYGIHLGSPKSLGVLYLIALLSIIPTFFFVISSLCCYFQSFAGSTERKNPSWTTVYVVGLLECLHLVILTISILYAINTFRKIFYYHPSEM